MSDVFLLDANVFIEANRVSYPLEIFPGFWDWLDQQNHAGVVKSVKPVYIEIAAGNDNLAEWVKERNTPEWFLSVEDHATQQAFADVANWIMLQNQKYSQPAIDEFLGVADPLLIAKAISLNASIVTLESNDHQNRRKVLIPVVCSNFGIKTLKTTDLLRHTGARFSLK
mgnify:FL=1